MANSTTLPDDNPLLVRAIIASNFAPPFMFSGVAIALPNMADELGAGATALSLVETLFLAGNLAFLLPAGRYADAADKRTLYKLGLLAFGLSSILIGSLSSMPVILAMRLLQGLASSVLSATGAAILADLVPPQRRGRVFGATLGVAYAGLSLGPICAGLLVDHWSWRAVFIVGGAALVCGYAFIQSMMPSSWQRAPGVVHLPSSVLLVATVACLVFGTATIRQGAPGYAGLAAGLALAIAFVRMQHRLTANFNPSRENPFSHARPPESSPQPLLDIDALVQNRILGTALLVQQLLYMSAFVSTFMLSIFMQISLGHSSKTSGRVIAVGSIVMALLAPVFGRLADRIRPDRLATAGVACVLASGLLATRVNAGTGLDFIAIMLAFQGLGFALFSSPNMTIIMNAGATNTGNAGASEAGAAISSGAGTTAPADADAGIEVRAPSSSVTAMASALAAMSRALGMVGGMLIASLLISRSIGNDPVERHPVRFIDITTTTFAVLAVLSGLALLVSLVSRPTPNSLTTDEHR